MNIKNVIQHSVLTALCLVFVVVFPSSVVAERLALVVGNTNYATAKVLPQPAGDAAKIAAALRSLDFDVTLLTDADLAGFTATLEEFRVRAQTAESALFYFAGHGFQLDGENFLVPVGAALNNQASLKAEVTSLNTVVAALQSRDRQTLLFLDASHENPLAAELQSLVSGQGLAEIQSGDGAFVAFSTAPNSLVTTGIDENSAFTKAFVHHVDEAGISISDMMIRVRVEVDKLTLGRQLPWDQSSLREQFYFKPDTRKLASLDSDSFEALLNDPNMTEEMKAGWLEFLQGDEGQAVFDDTQTAALIIEDIDGLVIENIDGDGDDDAGDESAAPVAEALPEASFSIGDAEDDVEEVAEVEAVEAQVVATAEEVEAVTVAPVVAAEVPQTEIAALPTVAPSQVEAVVPDEVATVTGTTVEQVLTPTAEVAAASVAEAPTVVAAVTSSPTETITATVVPAEVDVVAFEIPDDLATAAQAELSRLGCYRSSIDGKWGKNSRKAAVRFHIAINTPPTSTDPTEALYVLLKQQPTVVCQFTVASSVNTKKATEVKKTGTKVIKSSGEGGTPNKIITGSGGFR